MATFLSGLLYFSYMALICTCIFLLFGAVGFCATLYFTFKIYGAVKVD